MACALTIALPTYGREEILLSALRQVLDHRHAASMEVLVVDQTPEHEPDTEEQLRAWTGVGQVRLVRQVRPSLTAARNAALKEAAGRIVLFLDDDILLSPNLFREHLRMYEDETIAAVTGQVYNCADWRHPPPLECPARGTRPHSAATEECDARNVSGGNHSVRRAIALSVGGYDAAFVAAALGEDMDFSQRLLQAGHRIRYNPKAWIIHLGYPRGGCAITDSRTWPEWSHPASLLLYAFRHGIRQRNFGQILWMAVRHGPGRKEVLVRPWRWPAAWWGFLRGAAYGWRHRHFAGSLNLEP